jgi:ribosome-associated protein
MPDESHLTVKVPGGTVEIPLSEIEFGFARSGGPGGQNVNKVETKVEVRFRPSESSAFTEAQARRIEEKLANRITKDGDLLISSSETRYREQNREAALARLVSLLEGALKRPKRRKPTRPTRASRERRIRAKKERGEKKRLRKPPKRPPPE